MKFIGLFFFLGLGILCAQEPIPQRTADLSVRNEVQLAIDKGLDWLRKNQNPDGSWSLNEQPALTALPLSAFMAGPGRDFEKSPPAFLQKGYQFLLSSVQPDGGIYRKGLANYNTSISLMALLAAHDAKFDPTVRAARDFIISQQAKGLADPSLDGGMGYGSTGSARQHPDLSNTEAALDALYHSKIETGSELPHAKDLDWAAAIAFIQRCQNLPSVNKEKWASNDPENKGGFVYFPGESAAGEMQLPDGKKALRSYGSMSYAGLMSYLYADLKKDDPRVKAVMDWLRAHYSIEENPGMGSDGLFYYYQMMAKALHASGTREMKLANGREVDWRKDLALKLIDLQKPDGSWANDSGRWMEKDPVLSTSYALLTLEIIYRAL